MSELPYNNINSTLKVNPTNPPNYSQQLQYLTQGDYTLVIFAYLRSPAYKARNYTTHTKLDYKPPLSLQFNGKELQILEWGEVKRDKLDSNIFDKGNNENKAYYRIYSKDYDVIDKQDIPKLFSSYSLTYDILDTEKYYQSNHLKEQDIIVSMKQDTSLPKGSYYLYTKDIEQSLKIQTDYLYRARGYKALNIYTIDTNNQYKISYHSNPLDNIPYPKGTTFIIAPNTPIPTHYTDKKVKICLKGSRTYKDFILNLKQKIDTIQSQYEIERVRLEVGYESVDEQLSKYFTLTEVVKTNQKTSQFTKEQLTEFNRKEAMIVENYKKLQSLAKECDKIVDWIGYKPRVNSGVRVDIVNENLPNSSKKGKSQHTKCEALDLGFNSKDDLKKVYLAIHNNIIPNLNNQVFSQVILEKFSSSKIGWLHIALKTPKWNRGTEFKISYDGSSYAEFDKSQNMVDKF
ncbi:hypothetical protein [Helicobacter fennelliae]|uniref:Peptidase M15A C-terminal domain-containing protein n=1 Tax=Helicobacter fennelliae MRY12-0050 TaxID=1325130 RepID=T1DV99_9HELI|nr:hypothetical protein [Helicobacter fennelliae]GAD18558.1 hypothetical protein HFN_1970 [Helicobacter fennelliae MRY12-0050]